MKKPAMRVAKFSDTAPNHLYPVPQHEPLIWITRNRRIHRRTNSSHAPVTLKPAFLHKCNWNGQAMPFRVCSLGEAKRTSSPDTPPRSAQKRSFAHLASPDEIMARSACLTEPRAPTGSGFRSFATYVRQG
jgi:hypothetical protein